MSLKPSPYKVTNAPFKRAVEVPASKSYANRLLILGALNGNNFLIDNLPRSTDVLKLIELLVAVGLKIKNENDSIVFLNSFPSCERKNEERLLDGGDGGTTNRFLLPFLAQGKNRYKIKLKERLSERPWEPLLETLKSLGADATLQGETLSVQGPIKFDHKAIEIDSKLSSQFASGIQLALSQSAINVVAKNLSGSSTYFKMTQFLINEVKNGKKGFEVPIDWSSASYPMALAAVMGECEIHATLADPLQADSIFYELLKKIGAYLNFNQDHLVVRKNKILSLNVDCAEFPDLVPALVFVLSFAEGESKLTGLHSLKNKESDRVKEICKILDLVNKQYVVDEDSLTILGSDKRAPYFTYNAPSDHRMIMLTYLFMRAGEGGEILNSHHVGKSFPNFFSAMA